MQPPRRRRMPLLRLIMVLSLVAISSSAATDASDSDELEKIMELSQAEDDAKRRSLRGAQQENAERDPVEMIRRALTESDSDADENDEPVDMGEPDAIIDAQFAEFSESEEIDESDEEAEKDVTDLPANVEAAIERHVQQEIAKEMVALEDVQRRLSYDESLATIQNGCPLPTVPSQNSTCVQLIEDAFEKDYVKITRKKDQKIYKAQETYEAELEGIQSKLSTTLDEDALSRKCNWEEAASSHNFDQYRSCVKKAVRRSQAKAKVLRKAAKKRRKKRVKKQTVVFEKKRRKLLKLRAVLLPRCQVCVERLDPNNLNGGEYSPPPESLAY